MWCTGLVAPQHVGSSQTRDRTCVPCIGRRILNHCATREVLHILFLRELPEVESEEEREGGVGRLQHRNTVMLHMGAKSN